MKTIAICANPESALVKELVNLIKKMNLAIDFIDEPFSASGLVLDLQSIETTLLKKDVISENKKLFKSLRKLGQLPKSGICIKVQPNDIHDQNTALIGGAYGLFKTAALEWSEKFVKIIGIPSPTNWEPSVLAQYIIAEIFFGGLETEVHYDENGKRYILDIDSTSSSIQKPEVTIQDTVFLVSGGARGVTADCILALASKARGKYALLGRSSIQKEPVEFKEAHDLKSIQRVILERFKSNGQKVDIALMTKEANRIIANREIEYTLHELHQKGVQARYYAVDVANQTEVLTIVNEVRKDFGSIGGIIHGAGVLADKLIVDQTDEQFDLVFNTKVLGFKNLLEATSTDTIKHLYCFTSVAGFFGNIGQVTYAMANEVLNKWCLFEQTRRLEACDVKAMNWGPWDGGMVSDGIKQHFEQYGIEIIPRKEGVELFTKLVLTPSAEVLSVIGGGLEHWKQISPKPNKVAVLINELQFPYLKDHKVQGEIVMPIASICVLVQKWLAEAGYSKESRHIYQLQVLKGIRIPLQDANESIQMNMNQSESGAEFLIQILYQNQLCYKLKAGLPLVVSPRSKPVFDEKLSWNWDVNKIYQVLFHGPSLQVISSLDHYSSTSALCNITFHRQKNAMVELIDSGLQLVILWMAKTYDKSESLPMGFEQLIWHSNIQDNLLEAECYLEVVSSTPMESAFNLSFYSVNENTPILEIHGLRCIMYNLQ